MAWTKMKNAIAVGTAMLLVGGTMTIVGNKVIAQSGGESSIDESLWQADARMLQKMPPVLIIRPTKFAGGGGGMGGADDKVKLLNASLSGLLSAAYGFPESRMILPDNLSQERFDLMLTLSDHPRGALQAEIKKRFGLGGHPELRAADVLLLKIKNPNAPGLARSHGGKGSSMSSSMSSVSSVGNVPPGVMGRNSGGISPGDQITINNQTMSDFAQYLEKRLGRKVIDQTGTTNRFDVKLQVPAQNNESKEAALKRSILEQLGLVLVPSRESIEMLIVEKAHGSAKNSGLPSPVKSPPGPATAEPIQRESRAHLDQSYQWALAFLMFAQKHGYQLPDNFEQVKAYAAKNGLSDSNLEIVSGGNLKSFTNVSKTILLREKASWRSPDGKFVKAYGFADGHSELIRSPNDDFAALEKQRGFLVHPAKN